MSETNPDNHGGFASGIPEENAEQSREMEDEANRLLGRDNPPLSKKYRELIGQNR